VRFDVQACTVILLLMNSSIHHRLQKMEARRQSPTTPSHPIDLSVLDPVIAAMWQAVDFDITRLPTDELELLDEELRRHL
jgi:hypothetical protein